MRMCVYSAGLVQSDTLHVWGSRGIGQAALRRYHTYEDKASCNTFSWPRKDLTNRYKVIFICGSRNHRHNLWDKHWRQRVSEQGDLTLTPNVCLCCDDNVPLLLKPTAEKEKNAYQEAGTPERRLYCVDENIERRNHYLDLAGIENYTSKFDNTGKKLLYCFLSFAFICFSCGKR